MLVRSQPADVLTAYNTLCKIPGIECLTTKYNSRDATRITVRLPPLEACPFANFRIAFRATLKAALAMAERDSKYMVEFMSKEQSITLKDILNAYNNHNTVS